ncbi:MAG: IclR family transcriptional regulator [Dermatophilaceae bacterium]
MVTHAPLPENHAPRTQVVERVSLILAVLARHGATGCRLVDVARETGVARPSTHRLLQELRAIGYVRQIDEHRYTLGSVLFSLGLSAPKPIRSMRGIHVAAKELSNLCGDTVYVSIRHFDGVHYLVRTTGRFPIQVFAADVGDTVPFLNTYSGILLLAALGPAAEAGELARWESYKNEDWGEVDRERHTAQLKAALHQARTQGYVYGTDFFVPTIAGIAVPVPPRAGTPLLAVSVSAVESRLPPERVAALLPQLVTTAQRIAAFTD